MQFLRISTRKNLRVFTARPSFFVLYMIVYQSALIPRKLSCPQKFLVTRLLYRTHMVFVHKKLFFIQNTLSFIFKILIHHPCIQSIPLSTFEKKLNTDRKNSVRLEKHNLIFKIFTRMYAHSDSPLSCINWSSIHLVNKEIC